MLVLKVLVNKSLVIFDIITSLFNSNMILFNSVSNSSSLSIFSFKVKSSSIARVSEMTLSNFSATTKMFSICIKIRNLCTFPTSGANRVSINKFFIESGSNSPRPGIITFPACVIITNSSLYGLKFLRLI